MTLNTLLARYSLTRQLRETYNDETMDFNSLKDQVSNLTLYDLKAGVRKVQNGRIFVLQLASILDHQADYDIQAVMNYTEMESKVRDDLGPKKGTG